MGLRCTVGASSYSDIMWLLLQHNSQLWQSLQKIHSGISHYAEPNLHTMMSYRMRVACLYRNFKSRGHKFKPHLEMFKQYAFAVQYER